MRCPSPCTGMKLSCWSLSLTGGFPLPPYMLLPDRPQLLSLVLPLCSMLVLNVCTLCSVFDLLLTGFLIVLGDFGDFGTFAPPLPAVQVETPALNANPPCMFFVELAWFSPNYFAASSLPSGAVPHDMLMDATTSVPLNISPNTAITNWSSTPITDWPATPTSFQKREALAALSKRCPHVNIDVLLIALEEHNFVLEDASDLLLGVGMDDALTAFLVKVFPKVPRSIIDDRVSNCYSRYLDTFTSLVKEFHLYWNPHPHTVPSALSLSPPAVYRPDFAADGSTEMDKESIWWLTLTSTVRWQVSVPAPDNNTWSTVVKACMLSPTSYSPRMADLASRLTGPECEAAFSALMILLAYTALVDLMSNVAYRGVCTSIVHVLTTHGMASPGAVAWLYECMSTDLTLASSLSSSIPLYLKLSSSIWASWNTVLYTYRAEAAAPRSEPLFIDVDASSIVSTSGALDDTSIAPAPMSPSVSHITRTSTGSMSKKPTPYPSSKPPAQRRATDDDVHAAQTLICPPAPTLPEEVIELTSDSGLSDTTDLAMRTVMRAPSPVLADSPTSEPMAE